MVILDFDCSEMFALQSIVQQQGSQQQIFLPPRGPHQQFMQKVCARIIQLRSNHNSTVVSIQYLQSGPPPMSGIATPPNKRGRSPSPTPQYYKTNNPPYPPSQSNSTPLFHCLFFFVQSLDLRHSRTAYSFD